MHPALRFILSLAAALVSGVVTGIGTAVGYVVTIQYWATREEEWIAMAATPVFLGGGFAVGAIVAGMLVYKRLGR